MAYKRLDIPYTNPPNIINKPLHIKLALPIDILKYLWTIWYSTWNPPVVYPVFNIKPVAKPDIIPPYRRITTILVFPKLIKLVIWAVDFRKNGKSKLPATVLSVDFLSKSIKLRNKNDNDNIKTNKLISIL